jgi:translation initiation factor IF-1
MSKIKKIEHIGTVVKLNRGTKQISVSLQDGRVISAYIGGNLRRFKIRLLQGDCVKVEISSSDLSRGRLIRRMDKSDMK